MLTAANVTTVPELRSGQRARRRSIHLCEDQTVTIAVLPGDGIGPEVAAQAVRVLDSLGLAHTTHAFGGNAILAQGTPLPDETLAACREADAVLLGAVGLPELEGKPVRPEQGLLGLRRELDVYANLRPARAEGIDLLIVRELVGGLYFGAKGEREDGTWFDTCEYTRPQVERIALIAFEIAKEKGGRLTSVDKVNVMHTSRLWRDVVSTMGEADYPQVPLDHALVDSFAMTIVTAPESIDIVVTENTFGDILSDVAAAVTGGLGLAASASIGDAGPGIFEPVHGSAPAIAGQGIANPAAMLRSVALLLRHGLDRDDDANALERAIDQALVVAPTPDLGGDATTTELGDAVLHALGV
jgi:3-isopropylmalate dehydrogenase